MTQDEKKEKNQVTLFRDLLNRRVPQIFGIYLGVSWGLLQFLDWIVNRYMLSPHLVDLALVVLISLIPSVMVVAYCHGAPGRDKWGRTEKVVPPINIALCIFLVFFIFSDKDLSSISKRVTVENEAGEKIERVIPKSKFRKKIALFFFDNTSRNKEIDWLQRGVPAMLAFDLFQESFIDVLSTESQSFLTQEFYVFNELSAAGFKEAVGVPLLFKKKLAAKYHRDYFLAGSLAKEKEVFVVEAKLYRTKDAKNLASKSFRGADILGLIDQMTPWLKKSLDLPAARIDETTDLPLAEIYTKSYDAARYLSLSITTTIIQGDWKKAQVYLLKAVKEDPTFAAAHSALIQVYMLTNQMAKLKEVYPLLMKHSYKLPERLQYYVKLGYYGMKQQLDKQEAILKMLIKLYPSDATAYKVYAGMLDMKERFDEAIALYRQLLEAEPSRTEVFRRIGDLFEKKGDLEQALINYKKYAHHFPRDANSFMAIGGISEKLGNFKEAKEYYDKALIFNPEKISTLLTVAGLEIKLGNWDGAYQQYEETLAVCKTPQDRMQVYSSLKDYAEMRGRMKQALHYSKETIKAVKEYLSPVISLGVQIIYTRAYVAAGEAEEAFKIMESLKPQLLSVNGKLYNMGLLLIYMELKEFEKVEKEIPLVEALIKETGAARLSRFVVNARGLLLESRGDYKGAIKIYEDGLKTAPANGMMSRGLIRCHRQLKQYATAEEWSQKLLKVEPFSPKANYETALLYLDMGNKEKGLKHLNIALEAWKDADPDYKPALAAKEKRTELQASGN